MEGSLRDVGRLELFCGGLVAMAIGGGVALFNFLVSGRAYFIDDMQAQYVPTLYAIAHSMWVDGEVPFITLKSWFGGNLISEYQYGLYNPVVLLVTYGLPCFKDVSYGAVYLGVVYNIILTVGVYWLCCRFGVGKRLSLLAALFLSTNNLLFYWMASSWLPAFISIALSVWALAFVLDAHKGRFQFLFAVLGAYLVVTAGYPYGVIIYCIFVLLLCGSKLYLKKGGEAVFAGLAAALGGGLALISVLPLIGVSVAVARPNILFSNGLLVPGLGDVLALFNPFHRGRMLAYGGYEVIATPIFYGAWAILPILIFSVRYKLDQLSVLLLSMIFVSLVMCLGPEQIGPLRYSFRYIIYFHLFLSIYSVYVISKFGLRYSHRRMVVFLGLSVFLAIYSVQVNPLGWGRSILGFSIVTLLGGVIFYKARSLSGVRILMVAGVSVLCFMVSRLDVPRNINLPDWGLSGSAKLTHEKGLRDIPVGYEIDIVSGGGGASKFDEFVFGQIGLIRGRSTINGYSPLAHRALGEKFCLDVHGFICPDAASRLFEREESTGRTYADLMRVNNIVVQKDGRLSAFYAVRQDDFERNITGQWVESFSRKKKLIDLPGSLSWLSDGLRVESREPPNSELETIEVLRRKPEASVLVFSRLWWPGYHAKYNGVTVPVRPLGGILVAVDLPAGSGLGTLVLRYVPPGHDLAVRIACVSAVLVIVIILFWKYFLSLYDVVASYGARKFSSRKEGL